MTTREAAELLGITRDHLLGLTGTSEFCRQKAGRPAWASMLNPIRQGRGHPNRWLESEVKRAAKARRGTHKERRRVYFVLCVYPDGSQYIKVGIASYPKVRLSSMGSAHPVSALSLVAVFRPIAPSSARDVEKTLHGLLMDHRTSGEWFEHGPAMDLLGQITKNPAAFQLQIA